MTVANERSVCGFSEDPGTRDVLAVCGGNGAGLMRMRRLGLPVPEGFIITTQVYDLYVTALGIVAWFFVYFRVPETKGRSLEEIKVSFRGTTVFSSRVR
jgi:phosphoenolpyruvate synthase/pyruvate phosphate dikinase